MSAAATVQAPDRERVTRVLGSMQPVEDYQLRELGQPEDPRERLVMFDLDDTLIVGHVARPDPKGPFEEVQPFSVVKLLPGALETVRRLFSQGGKVAICTNKAGVAWGHCTVAECEEKRAEVERQLGITEEDHSAERFAWYEAYGHPEAPEGLWSFDDPMRKPRPGMLLRAMADLGEEPGTSTYVGDMDTDRQAAARAGVKFVLAKDYVK